MPTTAKGRKPDTGKTPAAKKPASPARRRRAPSRGAASNAASLRRADVILLTGLKNAVALEYTPGSTPIVLSVEKGQAAEDMIWAGQELGVPLVDIATMTPADFATFVPGQEIPEATYRPVAQALALLYRSSPSPAVVRFIRPVPAGRSRRSRSVDHVGEFEELFTRPPVSVEVGSDLLPYQEEWEEPLQQVRQRIATDTGLVIPPIPVRSGAGLAPSAFVIRFREAPIHSGVIDLPVDSPEKLFLLPNRVKQEIYRHGWELLGYIEVEGQLELVRKTAPGLYRALFPHHFSVAALRQVLRNLLREQLCVRDLRTILEVILENLPRTQDPDLLTECVRMAYSRSICDKYQDGEGHINAVVISPAVEKVMFGAVRESAGGRWLDLSSGEALRVLETITPTIREVASLGLAPVVLTTPMLRRFLARMIEHVFPDVPVLSYNEIAPLSEIRSVGTATF